ncbi:Cytochrome c family protein [hydrothermal vent metagenome]|uniref:Cytochrome c family protein n=1 Tax=hydrothermal vent metagenome TaxID=652676 RepID=A0A3B1BBA9_9ZZZZ
MKTKTYLGALVVAVAALAFVSGPAWAGIALTKHNLGSSSTAGNNQTADTGYICVFCHTPHGSDTSAPVPLWNRVLGSQGAAYNTYASLGTSTLDSKQAAIGSVSLACLSCHDGTQAMDVMINAPGSGGYNATGTDAGFNWTGSSVNAGGTITAGVTLIGTDLRNDHPIGTQYAGGGYTSSTPAPSSGNDPDFNAAKNTTIGSTLVWWVDTSTGTTNTREKTDMILYSRPSTDFAGGGTTEPSVECASCHDPHTSANPTFLRTSNVGSAVCLACHNK